MPTEFKSTTRKSVTSIIKLGSISEFKTVDFAVLKNIRHPNVKGVLLCPIFHFSWQLQGHSVNNLILILFCSIYIMKNLIT